MGKAKKRNFYNCIKSNLSLNGTLKREDAVSFVIDKFKQNDFGEETKSVITLFGISAEELAEAGAAYEDLLALKALFL